MALNWIFNAINPDYSVITSDECSERAGSHTWQVGKSERQTHTYTHEARNESEEMRNSEIVTTF